MIKTMQLPAVALLHEFLSYGPDTGMFVWKPRLPRHFTPTGKRTTEWLCRWWNTRFAGTQAGFTTPQGYMNIRVNGIDYKAHRLAWLMSFNEPPEYIDHINGVRDDNRIVNLRSVVWEDNTKNAKRRADNISGTTGVGYYTRKHVWRARINYKGKTILLGYFRTEPEAIAARRAAEVVYTYHANHGRPA